METGRPATGGCLSVCLIQKRLRTRGSRVEPGQMDKKPWHVSLISRRQAQRSCFITRRRDVSDRVSVHRCDDASGLGRAAGRPAGSVAILHPVIPLPWHEPLRHEAPVAKMSKGPDRRCWLPLIWPFGGGGTQTVSRWASAVGLLVTGPHVIDAWPGLFGTPRSPHCACGGDMGVCHGVRKSLRRTASAWPLPPLADRLSGLGRTAVPRSLVLTLLRISASNLLQDLAPPTGIGPPPRQDGPNDVAPNTGHGRRVLSIRVGALDLKSCVRFYNEGSVVDHNFEGKERTAEK